MAELKQIHIEELLEQLDNKVLIDVRSPKEYEEFHIPGAVSMPLFTNKEREIVGTLFKQKGQEQAKMKGLEFVSPKLPGLYKQILDLKTDENDIVIYCWRGGMRSKSLATFMTMMGTPCLQLKGGIRSFRKWNTERLSEIAAKKKPFVVIEGYTGSRKTDMLQVLANEGYPVLDLEGLAGHRGSIFGSVGLRPQSQKAFDCGLWQRLEQLKDAPYYIIEGESKRIGRVVLPDFINEGKAKGIGLLIQYPFEKRVRAIIEEYDPAHYREQITEAYMNLQKYLKPQLKPELDQAFESEDWECFVGLLLKHYYDPRYSHKREEYNRLTIPIQVSSVDEGVAEIKKELHRLFQSEPSVTTASIK
ncbi:MAG: tRNA 2-selenouridine(34) synthase MnmH [Tuberibacillus sp.]